MMRILLFLSCILTLQFCFGQNRRKLDSLLRLETKLKQDSSSVKHYLKISSAYKKSKPDSSYCYAAKALSLSVKLNDPYLIARSSMENYNIIRGVAKPAVLIDTLNKLKEDPRILASNRVMLTVIYELGLQFRKLASYDRSIKHLHQALDLAKELKETTMIFNSYNSLANTFSELGMVKHSKEDLMRALEFYDKASEFMNKGDLEQESNILNNKGVMYYHTGNLLKDTAYLRRSIPYFEEAFEMRKKMQKKETMIMTLDNLGCVYLSLSELGQDPRHLDLGRKYFELANQIAKGLPQYNTSNLNSNYGMHLALMGKLRKDKGLLEMGLKYLKSSYFISKESGEVGNAEHTSRLIANVFDDLKRYDSSVHYFKIHDKYATELLSLENKHVTEELAAKYELDLKDAENNNLKQQASLKEEVIARKSNAIKLMIAASIIMAGLMVVVFISRQKIKHSRMLIEAQQKETEAQKKIIEGKNKEIIDSINYAKRIQLSLMPTEKFIKRILKGKEG